MKEDIIMKLKEIYEKIYDKIFSVPAFRKLLKIPMLEKLLQYEIMSYLVFGVLTTVVNFAVTWILARIVGDDYETAVMFNIGTFPFRWIYVIQAVSWIAAVIFSFITNKLLVFESSSWKIGLFIKEFSSFVGARIFTFIVFEEILVTVITDILHAGDGESNLYFWVAKGLVAVLVVIFNYIASKLVIFRKKGDKNA